MTKAQAAWMAHDKIVSGLKQMESASIDLWDVRIIMENMCFSPEQFAEYVSIEESIYDATLRLKEFNGRITE